MKRILSLAVMGILLVSVASVLIRGKNAKADPNKISDKEIASLDWCVGEYCKCSSRHFCDDSAPLPDIPYYPYETISKKNYVFLLGEDRSFGQQLNQGSTLIEALEHKCPNKYIRLLQDGRRYMVYDTDDGCRLFLMMPSYDPMPWVIGYPILYKNKLSYSAFSSISNGDPFSKVEQIDDVCAVYRKEWADKGITYALSTIHYLDDGILRIDYSEADENGNRVVTKVQYFPEYIMTDCLGYEINYKINELDIP